MAALAENLKSMPSGAKVTVSYEAPDGGDEAIDVNAGSQYINGTD